MASLLHRTGVGLVVILMAGSVAPARGDMVQFTLGGVIDTADPLAGPFDSITPGSAFTVTYTFDTFTPDSDPLATVGTYAGAIQSFDVSIGSAALSGTKGDIGIRDEFFAGEEAHLASFSGGLFSVNSDIYFNTGTLASDALTASLNPADVFFGEFLMYETGEGTLAITGTYTSFGASPIPAPGAALLAVVGLGAVGILRRRIG